MTAQLLDLVSYRRKHSGSTALRKAFAAVKFDGSPILSSHRELYSSERDFKNEYYALRATAKDFLLMSWKLQEYKDKSSPEDVNRLSHIVRNLQQHLEVVTGAKYDPRT